MLEGTPDREEYRRHRTDPRWHLIVGSWPSRDWAVVDLGSGAAFALGFVLVMDAAKSRRLAQAMRTGVAGVGDGKSAQAQT